MRKVNMLTRERIKELFEYDANTGDLIWKVSRGTRKKGSIAGCINSEGYLCIGVARGAIKRNAA